MKKKRHVGLLPLILLAIFLGVLLGNFLPLWCVKIFATFNGIFGNLLQFLIPFIIMGLVTPAIGDIGKGAGRLLLLTAAISYFDTVFVGFLSYITSISVFPHLIGSGSGLSSVSKIESIAPYFTISIPPMVDVMSALVLSFILGLGISSLGSHYIKGVFNEFRTIIIKTIEKLVIPLLPVYIFGIFLTMTKNGQVYGIILTFIKVIVVIFILHILVIVLQYCIAGLVVKRNPFKLLYNMLPAYMTALGTSSSAATIPVTLNQTIKNGVSEQIAGFTVPLCATIHMAGSALKIVACSVAIIMMLGNPVVFQNYVGFILMLGLMIVAAPGVPGGAIMASLGILSSILGFDESEQALMIALYITMDNFGTACNVTGDGAIALIVDKIHNKNKIQTNTKS